MRAGAAVLRSLGIPDTDLPVAALTLRSFLQGFVQIELAERLADADQSFERGLDAVLGGLRR